MKNKHKKARVPEPAVVEVEAELQAEVEIAPEAEESPVEEPNDEALALLQQNSQTLAALEADVARLSQTESRRQDMLDDLHRELMEYRDDLINRLVRPMEMDVISMTDSLARTMETVHQWEPTEENFRKLTALLEGVGDDLVDLLYRVGVEPFSVPGTAVDVTKQKIVELVPTTQAGLDKTLAQRLAPGFEKDGKLLRPERIAVYVREQPQDE